MRNVSIKRKSQGRPIEFNLDGTLKDVEIHVVNLNYYGWEKVIKYYIYPLLYFNLHIQYLSIKKAIQILPHQHFLIAELFQDI